LDNIRSNYLNQLQVDDSLTLVEMFIAIISHPEQKVVLNMVTDLWNDRKSKLYT